MSINHFKMKDNIIKIKRFYFDFLDFDFDFDF